MILEGVVPHNVRYAESWSSADAIRLQARISEINRTFKTLGICENPQRTDPVLIVGPGIGADGVVARSYFPQARLLLLDVDFRAQTVAENVQLKNFSFVQGDLVVNACVLETLLKSDSIDMCFALRSSSEIVLNLLSFFDKQEKKCILVFSLIVNSEPQELFTTVKSTVAKLHGKSKYLFEGRSFTEQGFVVCVGREQSSQS